MTGQIYRRDKLPRSDEKTITFKMTGGAGEAVR